MKLEFPRDFLNKIICGDAIQVMKQIPSGSVDLVVTSPPFKGNKIQRKVYVAWQRECLKQMMRVISKDGAIFYNQTWQVQDGLQNRQDIITGFPLRQIIIWVRKGRSDLNEGYFLPGYKVFYLIAKPEFKLNSKAGAYTDVWEFAPAVKREHPTPLPVKLVDRIISCTNAKTILDPFMGSGTTAISAMNFNRNYIGIEISPKYCQMSAKRIKIHQSQKTDD